MYTYESLKNHIMTGKSKYERKIAHNTIARFENDNIVIRFHDIDIGVYDRNGDIKIFTGGWKTFTTKERLNDLIPNPYRIYQDHGVWYIWDYKSQNTYVYQDGIVFKPDSNGGYMVMNAGTKEEEKRIKDLRKAINKYVAGYIKALISGKIQAPDSGDCFYCLMRTQEGITLGEASQDVDHLISHFDEKYYVPSLFYRAIEIFPISQMAMWGLGKLWQSNESLDKWESSILEDQGKSSLQKYLLRQFQLG